MADKPKAIQKLPLLGPDQIADIQRGYRCELESLLSVDRGVKQVIDALEANGVLDDTLIVYTSDNGYFHGEHRIPRDKDHIYEESIRVPLEMRGPGVPQGETVNDLVINADLAPTVLDAANVTAARSMDGTSLLPVANTPGIEGGRELLIEEPTFKAIRTEHYMYAEYDTGERELYDLRKDPLRARQPPQRPCVCRRQGRARQAPGRAQDLLRRQLSRPRAGAPEPVATPDRRARAGGWLDLRGRVLDVLKGGRAARRVARGIGRLGAQRGGGVVGHQDGDPGRVELCRGSLRRRGARCSRRS